MSDREFRGREGNGSDHKHMFFGIKALEFPICQALESLEKFYLNFFEKIMLQCVKHLKVWRDFT